MAYKSILTVLSEPTNSAQLNAARQITRSEQGHLDILCLGLDLSQPGYYFPGGAPYVFQEGLDMAENSAASMKRDCADDLSGSADLRWNVEAAVAQIGGVTNLVGGRARYSDLTVMGQPYGETSSNGSEAIIEAAMFEGGCPILVIPESGLPSPEFKRVLIAWNQSDEAMTAVRRAMPLLRRAEHVEITAIDPGRSGVEGGEPGAALAQFLVRHDVRAEVAVISRTEATISDQLNKRALEIDADLIVMGAYGHSRFREAILGGATRYMLEKSRIPVFMAR